MRKINWIQLPDGYLDKTPVFQFILLSSLFPLWGAAAALNDILVSQFKTVFELSNVACVLVQSTFYGGYFLIAIPASQVIRKTSYKTTILLGLAMYIIGCALFYPASIKATYTMFLVAIFTIAIGLSFLETAANTYSSMLGNIEHASLRLNISQTFHPLGAICGILLGKYLIFQEGASLEARLEGLTPDQVAQFRLDALHHTLEPYRLLIFILLVVFILFSLTRFPSCKVQKKNDKGASIGLWEALRDLRQNARFRQGVIAQFLYVGMQVSVWSFTIRLALESSDVNERMASDFMVYSFGCFFAGRFIASFLMSRISASKVLVIYSIVGTLLLGYTCLTSNITGVYAAVVVSVLFGPCWPTIFAETLRSVDGKHKELAGGVLIMSILGGAVVPVVQGLVSDMADSLQLSYIVPSLCFVYIGFYFFQVCRADDPALGQNAP